AAPGVHAAGVPLAHDAPVERDLGHHVEPRNSDQQRSLVRRQHVMYVIEDREGDVVSQLPGGEVVDQHLGLRAGKEQVAAQRGALEQDGRLIGRADRGGRGVLDALLDHAIGQSDPQDQPLGVLVPAWLLLGDGPRVALAAADKQQVSELPPRLAIIASEVGDNRREAAHVRSQSMLLRLKLAVSITMRSSYFTEVIFSLSVVTSAQV